MQDAPIRIPRLKKVLVEAPEKDIFYETKNIHDTGLYGKIFTDYGRVDWPAFLEKISLETFSYHTFKHTEVIALREPLKVRTITKADGLTSYLSRPL